MKIHPAAEAFPMCDAERFAELKADIETNGQRDPILLYDGAILDGRNRHKACVELGLEPICETVSQGLDPWAYVWSKNGARRDLQEVQRALVRIKILEGSASWQATQAAIADAANVKRSAAMQGLPHAGKGEKRKENVADQVDPSLSGKHVAREAKAEAAGVSAGAMGRAEQIHKHPELAEKVISGELKTAEALRTIQRQSLKKKLDAIAEQQTSPVTGVFDVVVIDPPWPMKKIERDLFPDQVDMDYPTMSEAELMGLDIPMADNCHVWLWTTHKHLPLAFRMLSEWHLKYVCAFVWHKPGGFQPVGLPQFNCEFALYARRGTPEFIDTKAFNVCFDAPRGKHSEKPSAFYDVVRRVTAGRRLDMFNRRAIDGFIGWGNEAQ